MLRVTNPRVGQPCSVEAKGNVPRMDLESLGRDLVYHPEAPDLVMKFALDLGLVVSEHESKGYKGSRHWHVKKSGERGVVEVTWWPEKDKLWVSVRSNRQGNWTADAVAALTTFFGQKLDL